MLPLIGGLLGGANAGLSLVKDKKNKELQSATALYSPWTGMKPDTANLNTANPLGDVGAGVLSGYSLDQNLERNALENEYLKKLNKSPLPGSAWVSMGPAMQPFSYKNSLLGVS